MAHDLHGLMLRASLLRTLIIIIILYGIMIVIIIMIIITFLELDTEYLGLE